MITSKRNQQLQQLGIIQWILRRPMVLQNKITISLPLHIRLVIVTNNLLTLSETLLSNVLYVLKISPYQVLQLTPNHVTMLPPNSYCNSWWLGCKKNLKLKGRQLSSPSLEELQRNPHAKDILWKQICKYEHDFLSCIFSEN